MGRVGWVEVKPQGTDIAGILHTLAVEVKLLRPKNPAFTTSLLVAPVPPVVILAAGTEDVGKARTSTFFNASRTCRRSSARSF